jgi:hypothetical protein
VTHALFPFRLPCTRFGYAIQTKVLDNGFAIGRPF